MSQPILALRSDSIAIAGSTIKTLIPAWVSCEYGRALDSIEPCTLVLLYNDPVMSTLAIRDVLYIQNEIGAVYEYRIKKIEDSLAGSTVKITASPILHDLNDIVVTSTNAGGERAQALGTYPPSGWWDFVILPCLQRSGITWWARGTFDLVRDTTDSNSNQTVMGLLRAITNGTGYTLSERLVDTGGGVYKYYLDITKPTTAYTALVLVGSNVIALDKDVDTDLQVTRVYPYGETYNDGTPSSIGNTPWQIGTTVGAVVQVVDPEFGTADFAIENDQFAPNTTLGFAGYTLTAGRLTAPNVVPVVGGASTRWCDCIAAAGRKLYVPIQKNSASGEVHVYSYDTELWSGPITVGENPTGACFVPTVGTIGYVYVSCSVAGNVKVIDPASDTVVATITTNIGTTPGAMLYHATLDRIFLASSSGLVVINPNTNTAAAAVTGGTTNDCQRLTFVDVSSEIWTCNSASKYLHRYTLAASPAYVGEYDVGLVTDGPCAIHWDSTNDKIWVTYYTGNHLKCITRSTGVVHTDFNTATTPNAGSARWINSYAGTIYTTHTTGRVARWNGSTVAYTDITTVDASGGEYYTMTSVTPGESAALLCGVGKRVSWWDMVTHTAFVLRWIKNVTAGSPSSCTMAGGSSLPFTTGDVTLLYTRAGVPVTNLHTNAGIITYGEIQRPLSYQGAKLLPNMVGRPKLDSWLVDEKTMAHWSLPQTSRSDVRSGTTATLSLGLIIQISGTGTHG